MSRVTLRIWPWKGDSRCEPDEAVALLAELLVDGEPLEYADGRVTLGGPLGGGSDFIVVQLRGVPDSVRAAFDPDVLLEGTTDDTIVVSLQGVEYAP